MSVLGAVAASVAAPIVGGLIGQSQSAGDSKKQKKLLDQAAEQILSAMPPDPEDQYLYFEELKRQGLYTPELEELVQLKGTAFDQIQSDPRLKEAQLAALQRLQDVGEDGYTLEDKAALQRVQSEVAGQERGAREAILANARARGVSGSGMELAAQLAAQQEAANRNSQAGLDIAAQAQRRALEAMMQSGQLAGNIRAQDFEEQARIAQARDAIQAFNATNRTGWNQRNTDRLNEGQRYNLGEDQRIADANVDIRNRGQVWNKVDRVNQAYDRELEKRRAAAGALGAKADYYGQRAAQTQNMWGGIGQGVGQGVNAYLNYKMLNEDDEE